MRRGLGKTRHIEVQHLWSQRVFQDRKAILSKVPTDDSPSDLGTKYLDAKRTWRIMTETLGFIRQDGTSALMLKAA
eukprot:1235817-Heterocapsa_arctica.AAC.1